MEYFAQRLNQPSDKNSHQNLDTFFTPLGAFLAGKGGYSWELAGVFSSNVPLALLIDPWKCSSGQHSKFLRYYEVDMSCTCPHPSHFWFGKQRRHRQRSNATIYHSHKNYHYMFLIHTSNLSNSLSLSNQDLMWNIIISILDHNQPGRVRITASGSGDAQYAKCARHLF